MIHIYLKLNLYGMKLYINGNVFLFCLRLGKVHLSGCGMWSGMHKFGEGDEQMLRGKEQKQKRLRGKLVY